jgi:hypothetical protein
MTFDAWQTLINFGTKPLDENERIFQSSDPIADALIRNGKLVYAHIAPHVWAGSDRGFYFQPVLIECNFGDYLPSIAHEPSLISLSGIKGLKQLRDPDGDTYSLPFFPCNILVNRTLFSTQRPREDENTWLNNLTERRRAIAHELLYANQYAQFYDVELDALTQSISTPTASEEEEFMCPMDVVEKTLNTFETRHGLRFLTPGNFVDTDSSILRTYYSTWLRDYAVSERVCHEQTLNYLRNGIRGHVRDNAADLKRQISEIIGEDDPKSEHFHSFLQNGHPRVGELIDMCSQIGRRFNVSSDLTIIVIAHTLDLTQGAGI